MLGKWGARFHWLHGCSDVECHAFMCCVPVTLPRICWTLAHVDLSLGTIFFQAPVADRMDETECVLPAKLRSKARLHCALPKQQLRFRPDTFANSCTEPSLPAT